MEAVDYLRAEEVAKLLEAADARGARDALMVRVPLFTGARIGEVSPLAVADCEPSIGRIKLSKVCFSQGDLYGISKGGPMYDPTRPLILVLEGPNGYTGHKIRFKPAPFESKLVGKKTVPKGGHWTEEILRKIWAEPLEYFRSHELAYEIVKEGLKSSQPTRVVPFVDGRSRQLLADWIREHAANEFVFPSQKGGRLQEQQIQRTVTKIMAEAGLPDAKCYPHMLRHTFAVHFLQKNPGAIFQLARILGHTNIKTTTIYLRFVVEDLQRLLESSGNLFSGAT